MPITLLGPSNYVSMPWKNGKGETLELNSEESDDDTGFLWRLSIASVVEEGLFSDFTDYQRILILLDGNGMTLDHKEKSPLITRYDYCEFKGETNTHATLHDGPITDFNIMCREGRYKARPPKIITDQKTDVASDAQHQFFYAAELPGKWWSADKPQPITIPSQHLLWISQCETDSAYAQGAGIIQIQIDSVLP